MPEDEGIINVESITDKILPEIVYNSEKDFYKGLSGELRYKAEGLFKKAKEKGISIEDISIITLRENSEDFPGIGIVELPTYIVKVKGRHISSGRVILDGKQIDYYNRYKKYTADKIEEKNFIRDEKGRVLREGGKPKFKDLPELVLNDWEKFEIGKLLVNDKEFGLEKTITGACDRVIRKLMGENDWLYPQEARLLDEEFNSVQSIVAGERETRRDRLAPVQKKATERQINYLKSKIRNSGIDPENTAVIREVLKQAGIDASDMSEISTGEMSRIIDGLGSILTRVRATLEEAKAASALKLEGGNTTGNNLRQ